MVRRALDWIGTAPARIVTGILTLIALAVLLQPDAAWRPDWEKVAGFATALVVWLVAEARASTAQHPHDLRLMALIEATVTPNERANLRSMEMSEDFQWRDFGGLQAVAVWEGPDYGFLDRALQKKWAPTLASLQAFRTELARRSMPMPGADGWYSVKAEARRDVWEADTTFLNAASDALTKELDEFLVFSRRRLSV